MSAAAALLNTSASVAPLARLEGRRLVSLFLHTEPTAVIHNRARICRLLQEPRNRFPACRAGTTTLFVVPARQATSRLAKSMPRNRFLGSINVYIYGLSSEAAGFLSVRFCFCINEKSFSLIFKNIIKQNITLRAGCPWISKELLRNNLSLTGTSYTPVTKFNLHIIFYNLYLLVKPST